MDTLYTRNCPQCGDIIKYKTKKSLAWAQKNNSKCHTNCFGKTKPLHKICSKCRIEKPFNDFGKQSSPDGLNSVCKECAYIRVKEYTAEQKEKPIEEKPQRPCPSCGIIIYYNSRNHYAAAIRKNSKCSIGCLGPVKPLHKICSECKEEKSLSEFGVNKTCANGIRPQCKKCEYEKYKLWIKKNPEKYLKKAQRYRRKRRARKSQVNENYTQIDEQITYIAFGHQCFKCGNSKTVIDHHMPLSLGYPLTIFNAVPLCQHCNSYKHTKLPQYFYTPEELKRIEEIFISILLSITFTYFYLLLQI